MILKCLRFMTTRPVDLPAVPDDRLVPIRSRAGAPATADLLAFWQRCWDHSERIHNGDGSWGRGNESWDPAWLSLNFVTVSHTPLPRHSARMILSCLPLLQSDVAVYPGRELLETRLRQAADYLCAMIEPAGFYATYTRSTRGVRPFESGFDSVLYPTGLGLQALALASAYFKEAEYRSVAAQIFAWDKTFPLSPNYNFDAFLVTGSAVYQRVCAPEANLSAALVRLGPTLAYQQPHGGWLGAPLSGRHNAYTWYHSVCVQACLGLLAALPEREESTRRLLRRACYRGVNYILNLQREDGSLQVHPEDPRTGNVAETARMLITAEAVLGVDLGAAIDGLMAWQIGPESGDPDVMHSLHFPPKGDTHTADHISYTMLPLGHYLARRLS